MHSLIVPGLVAASCGATILLIGGLSEEIYVLASLCGAIFGDLARRAQRERSVGCGDSTDFATALGFMAILAAAAFDLGRDEALSWDGARWLAHGAAFVVILAGLGLRAASLRALGAGYAVRLQTHAEQTLVRSGPYRVIRHPNYAALCIIACGIAFGLQSPLALAVACAVWLPLVMLRIAREEQMLVARFGEAYRDYRRGTWRMLPGVY